MHSSRVRFCPWLHRTDWVLRGASFTELVPDHRWVGCPMRRVGAQRHRLSGMEAAV